jgi:hypothetical protein
MVSCAAFGVAISALAGGAPGTGLAALGLGLGGLLLNTFVWWLLPRTK